MPEQSSRPDRPIKGPQLRRALLRTARALLGKEALPRGASGPRPDQELADRVVAAAKQQRALATYADQLARGVGTQAAQVATIRALLDIGSVHVARAFSVGLASDEMGRLGLGLTKTAMGRYRYGWGHFQGLDRGLLVRHAVVEAVHCALFVGDDEAVEAARELVAEPSRLQTSALAPLAGRFLVSGLADVARDLAEEAARRVDLDEADRARLDALRRWLDRAPTGTATQSRPGRVVLGVIDYYQPDLGRASWNVGDYVQTLAMLGHLARFEDVRFHGGDGLGALAAGLRERVPGPLRIAGVTADVELVPVSRDYSEGDDLPPDTWTLVFGWHMHPLFDLRYGLPYHRNVNPLFVSFHLARPEALTPEAVDYLRQHAPIGCRDWYTVDLLMGAGVDAFFSGCLTTTVNGVFRPREEVREPDQVVAVVDLPRNVVPKAKRPVEHLTHGDRAFQALSLVDGVRLADDLLTTYQRRFHRVVTSRLHSYLPALSLGVPVSFRPSNPSDVRLEGLAGMAPDDPALREMQDGLRALLAGTLELVITGAPAEEVRRHWKEATADAVTAARRRFEAPPLPFTGGIEPARLAAAARESAHAYGPHGTVDQAVVTDVTLSLDQNMRHVLPVAMESIVANASGPLRLWVTSRGLDEDYRTWVAAAFPDVPLTFLDFDGVDYGVVTRLLSRITLATMDRLLLPEVLPDLDRVTYIDLDTVTLGDVCELHRTDLAGHPLAVRSGFASALHTWRRAGDLLEPAKASELRRIVSRRHRGGYLSINAGVLVLDLARMRSDRFVEEFVPMAPEYGLHDQDIVLAYVGPDRRDLDPVWNTLPQNEAVDRARIVHYAGAGKPWQDSLVPHGDIWLRYARRLTDRVGENPWWPSGG